MSFTPALELHPDRHRLDEDEALETAHDLVVTLPKRASKL